MIKIRAPVYCAYSRSSVILYLMCFNRFETGHAACDICIFTRVSVSDTHTPFDAAGISYKRTHSSLSARYALVKLTLD